MPGIGFTLDPRLERRHLLRQQFAVAARSGERTRRAAGLQVHRHQPKLVRSARKERGNHAAAYGVVDRQRLVFRLATKRQAATDREAVLLRMRARTEAEIV